MREHPILFSAPMVRAILDGRKTQTRRVVKGIPSDAEEVFWWTPEGGVERPGWADPGVYYRTPRGLHTICPPWRVGEKLWVRETWAWSGVTKTTDSSDTWYRATHYKGEDCGIRWRPSIHMPRWASRITLEVTGVRAERVGDISADDAKAEGAVFDPSESSMPAAATYYKSLNDAGHIGKFRDLWNSLAKPGETWDANPWVWVIKFRLEAK